MNFALTRLVRSATSATFFLMPVFYNSTNVVLVGQPPLQSGPSVARFLHSKSPEIFTTWVQPG